MKRLEDMRSQGDSLWKILVPDFKLTFILWLPLFALALAFGIQQRYPNLVLFSIAMAVGVWGVCDAAVIAYRKVREYRAQKRRQTPLR